MAFNLREEIKLRRPNIGENSLKIYLANLSKLNDKQPIDSLDFLKDIDNVKNIFTKYSTPTQRNYITSILVGLSIYDNGENWKDWEPVYEKYKKILEDKTSDYQKNIESHRKNQKQQDGWVSRADQLKLINKYKKQLKDMNFSLESPSKAGFKIFQHLVVVALYYYAPPRRLDYAPMEIIYTRDDDDGKKNYLLVLSKSKKYFIFNKFKTAKIYGKQEIQVTDKKLNKLLNDWLVVIGDKKSNSFLFNSKNQPLSSNGLGKLITEAYMPSGISTVTVNILRHVYATEMVGVEMIDKENDRKKIAKEMGHSKDEQLNYIKV